MTVLMVIARLVVMQLCQLGYLLIYFGLGV